MHALRAKGISFRTAASARLTAGVGRMRFVRKRNAAARFGLQAAARDLVVARVDRASSNAECCFVSTRMFGMLEG